MTDSHFYSWFSGFADGEAHFGIKVVNHTKQAWSPSFEIGLRLDDVMVLERLRAEFGGVIYYRSGRGGNQKPQASWKVHKLSELMGLVRHFETYPLLAKKSGDFAVWKQAVVHLYENTRVSTGRRANSVDGARMAELASALKQGREFRGKHLRVVA